MSVTSIKYSPHYTIRQMNSQQCSGVIKQDNAKSHDHGDPDQQIQNIPYCFLIQTLSILTGICRQDIVVIAVVTFIFERPFSIRCDSDTISLVRHLCLSLHFGVSTGVVADIPGTFIRCRLVPGFLGSGCFLFSRQQIPTFLTAGRLVTLYLCTAFWACSHCFLLNSTKIRWAHKKRTHRSSTQTDVQAGTNTVSSPV